jgi:hypothetical protein
MQYALTSDAAQVNREVLVTWYEALAEGDIETVRATLADEFGWRVNGPSPVAGVYRGTEAERWPRDGVPPNPGGWLVTTARNRAIDRIRRSSVLERKTREPRPRKRPSLSAQTGVPTPHWASARAYARQPSIRP